ncbi:phenylalanine--tRNA ligase subunit alpha, partial [Staphylococcus haemolyticus]|nr:phenylalanine--tRNA ligase subunit alpha [Staphylococcus haemolyticus]
MTQNDSMAELKQQALVDINETQNERELQDVKVKYLGKKGSVSGLMKNMKDLPNEEKPVYGQKVNELRQTIQKELDGKQELLKNEKLNQQLAEETIDVTLPSRQISIGSKHPLTRTVEEIEDL